MYVIKRKNCHYQVKGAGEIILAELGPSQMLGEWLFDNRPRSAGAKALEATEVIILHLNPFMPNLKLFQNG